MIGEISPFHQLLSRKAVSEYFVKSPDFDNHSAPSFIICGWDSDMEELKDLLKLLLGFAAVAAFVWLYLKVNLFFFEHGWSFRWKREPPRAEIQTLFHGNTKDDRDQI